MVTEQEQIVNGAAVESEKVNLLETPPPKQKKRLAKKEYCRAQCPLKACKK